MECGIRIDVLRVLGNAIQDRVIWTVVVILATTASPATLHLPIGGVVLLLLQLGHLLLVVPLLARRVLVVLQVHRNAVVVAQYLAVV